MSTPDDVLDAHVVDDADTPFASLAPRAPTQLTATGSRAIQPLEWSREQINLLKATVARDTSDEELRLFMHVCKRTGLDPFVRQIYAIKRRDGDGNPRMTIQTGIDAFRLIAERSGEYAGQLGPFWSNDRGEWTDLWLPDAPPFAAKVAAIRRGFVEPLWAVARWKDYLPANPREQFMWKRMAPPQLAKCAEALALRRAFPQELGGMYIHEEMAQMGRKDDAPRALRARVDHLKVQLANARTAAGAEAVMRDRADLVAELRETDSDEARALLAEVERAGAARISELSVEKPLAERVKLFVEYLSRAEKVPLLEQRWSQLPESIALKDEVRRADKAMYDEMVEEYDKLHLKLRQKTHGDKS